MQTSLPEMMDAAARSFLEWLPEGGPAPVLIGSAALLLHGLRDVDPHDVDFMLSRTLIDWVRRAGAKSDGGLGPALQRFEIMTDKGVHARLLFGETPVDLLLPSEKDWACLWAHSEVVPRTELPCRIASIEAILAMKLTRLSGRDLRHVVSILNLGIDTELTGEMGRFSLRSGIPRGVWSWRFWSRPLPQVETLGMGC